MLCVSTQADTRQGLRHPVYQAKQLRTEREDSVHSLSEEDTESDTEVENIISRKEIPTPALG